ncbi:MAG: PH domain-containing protein [Mycobacteriales bacterium]
MAEANEQILLETRPHWRRLVPAAVMVPVIVGGASFAEAATPSGRLHAALRIAELVVALALLARYSLRPWLRWRSSWLTVTDRRVGWRSGVLRRRGRDLPLHRISEVTYDQRLIERIFAVGTLRVEPSGEGGTLVVADVPRVREVHRLLVGRTGSQPLP